MALLKMLVKIYNYLDNIWNSDKTPKLLSRALLAAFLLSILYVEAARRFFHNQNITHYLAIEVAFTVLLIIEVLGLIFILPKSVADSIGKQFEVLSIIFLRSAFKEFGYLPEPLVWQNEAVGLVSQMFTDAFGALVIFLLIGWYYRLQRHKPITESEKEQTNFIMLKKILSLGLLIIFSVLGFFDLWHFFLQHLFHLSLNIFYTILIFADIIILLYSLRFTTRYANIFRYSSFVLTTIMIRLALTATSFINVGLGIAAALFAVGLSIVYNWFGKQEKVFAEG